MGYGMYVSTWCARQTTGLCKMCVETDKLSIQS